MSIDPAKLAQMDREKAFWDAKVTELVDAYRRLKAENPDSSVALFELMERLANVDAWKLRTTLASATQRLAEAP